MFQQEEATDAQPEQGNHHASEVATMALPSLGRAKAVVRWPTGTAGSSQAWHLGAIWRGSSLLLCRQS